MIYSRQSAVRLIGPNGLLMYLLKKHIINHTNKTPDGAGVVHGTGCCIGWNKRYKADGAVHFSMHIQRMQSAQPPGVIFKHTTRHALHGMACVRCTQQIAHLKLKLRESDRLPRQAHKGQSGSGGNQKDGSEQGGDMHVVCKTAHTLAVR
jgi:hypothetical protein